MTLLMIVKCFLFFFLFFCCFRWYSMTNATCAQNEGVSLSVAMVFICIFINLPKYSCFHVEKLCCQRNRWKYVSRLMHVKAVDYAHDSITRNDRRFLNFCICKFCLFRLVSFNWCYLRCDCTVDRWNHTPTKSNSIVTIADNLNSIILLIVAIVGIWVLSDLFIRCASMFFFFN